MIEVLAAVFLISLVAGVVAVRLGSTQDRSVLRATEAALKNLDLRARTLARSEGPLSLAVSRDGNTIVLSTIQGKETLRKMDLASDYRVQLMSPGRIAAITFDQAGRSRDYEVVLSTRQQVSRWQVFGATGWISAEEL